MSDEQVQEPRPGPEAESWLKQNTRLAAPNRQSLALAIPPLLERINTDRHTTIGLSGAPGSGKSTLARVIVHCLHKAGIPACLLSLDDYYLAREKRETLANDVHPLFRQRGVPGTHELNRLLADLDQIQRGELSSLRLPVFDKSIDDRVADREWPFPARAPRVIIIEGWCIGAPPQTLSGTDYPASAMEHLHDADGRWRRRVQDAWQHMYSELRGRLDQVWYIRVPEWDSLIDWRWQQEQELPHRNLDSRTGVRDFLGCFEGIVRYMQDSYPQWADLVLETDCNHHIKLSEQSENSK